MEKKFIHSTISRIINRYSKLAGVKKIQAKGLRHSHASYLINEFNVSVVVLSQRMGHSSPEIAEKITGNITIRTANRTKFKFNGNQSLKK